jgi:hypothetical protein
MSDQLFKEFDREYDLSLFYWINKHALKKDGYLTVSDDPINQLIDAVEAVIELARYYFADDKKDSSIVAVKDDPLDPHKAEIQELRADQFMSDIEKCFPTLTIDRQILDAKLQNDRCTKLEEKALLQSVLFINQAANEAMRGRKIGVLRKESNFIRPGTKLMRSVTFQQIFDTFLHYQGPLSAGRTCLGISKENGLN